MLERAAHHQERELDALLQALVGLLGPLMILVMKPGAAAPDLAAMNAFLADKVAKWWLPDDLVVVDEIPHTATGKILKTKLRETFKDHRPKG